MATIIENRVGRRSIMISTDDIINIVREYQSITADKHSYEDIRLALDSKTLFLPEDVL